MEDLEGLSKIEERIVLKATASHMPISGTFELTPLCNMNCHMCFIRLNQNEMHQQGRLRTVDEWLRVAYEMKKAGTLFVLLTGGEPLLYPHFFELYQGLRELGMIITINTNGTLITEEIAKALSIDKPRRVNISLYGKDNATYEKLCHNPQGYDQTIAGIELLLKYHIDVKLNGTIVPENASQIQDLQNIADKYNLYIKMDSYLFPSHRERSCHFDKTSRIPAKQLASKSLEILKMQCTQEEYQQYKEEMLYKSQLQPNPVQQLECRAGRSAFWINWQGLMSGCIFIQKNAIDVFEHGFETSWKHVVDATAQLTIPKICTTCSNRNICEICGASAMLEEYKDGKPFYMCEYIEEKLKLLEGE